MALYSELEIDSFYLVRMEEGDEIMLIQLLMETGRCVLVWSETNDEEITFWKEKTDELFEITDELDEEQAALYESLFEEDEEDEESDFI